MMAFKKQSNETIGTINNKKAVISIGPLESRGSKMLKAALNNKTITPLKDRAPTATADDNFNVTTVQQGMKNSKRRSPKNNVLFREPVVSQEYQYEQTYFDETNEPRKHEIPDKAHGDEALQHKQPNGENTKRIDDNDNNDNDYDKHDEFLETQSYEFGEVDDDGDFFTMAPSDASTSTDDELKRQANGATKRLHRSLEEEDEQDAAKQTGRDEYSSGGLFSSPKVAKIAPYFDERPHEKKTSDARAINKNRLRSLQQRSLYTRRYTIKRNDSVLSQTRGQLNTVPHDRVTDLTLSSYKKFSSPQICKNTEPKTAPPTDETNCKSEANGYFGWIATFITNQMNKLIF